MARAPPTLEIEETPEADRLNAFPHPRETVRLFGHEGAERRLARAFAGARMHQGFLVTGAEGIGKATLAYKFAAHVLAKPGERDPAGQSLAVAPDTTAARQVRSLSHPGLVVMRRTWQHKDKRFTASLPVDEVRRLRDFLGHTAGEDSWRVALVDTADDLNVNAANALLKMLEEPPPQTVFLLLSSEPGRLLPTIRSRCRVLAIEAPPAEAFQHAVAQALEAAGQPLPEKDAWPILERLSERSVRKALGLAGAKGLELYERTFALVASLPNIDWRSTHSLSDELQFVPANDRFELFFELLLGLLSRMIRAVAEGYGEGPEGDLARRLIPEPRLASWAELWETIVRDKAQVLALNLDRKLLILETLSRLESVARR